MCPPLTPHQTLSPQDTGHSPGWLQVPKIPCTGWVPSQTLDCQSHQETCWECAGTPLLGTPGVRASGCILSRTAQLTGTWPPFLHSYSHPLVLALVQSFSSTSAFPAQLLTPEATALLTLGFCPSPPPAYQSPWGDDGPCENHPPGAGVPLLHQHWVLMICSSINEHRELQIPGGLYAHVAFTALPQWLSHLSVSHTLTGFSSSSVACNIFLPRFATNSPLAKPVTLVIAHQVNFLLLPFPDSLNVPPPPRHLQGGHPKLFLQPVRLPQRRENPTWYKSQVLSFRTTPESLGYLETSTKWGKLALEFS